MAHKNNLNQEKFISRLKTNASQHLRDAQTFLERRYRLANAYFSRTSTFGLIITVCFELMEFILFYLETAIQEQNPNTATNLRSLRGHAALTGHDAFRGQSARGKIEIKPSVTNRADIPSNWILIPHGLQLQSQNNGLIYSVLLTKSYLRIPKNAVDYINVTIVQGEFQTQSFTSDGTNLQSYNIQANKTIDHWYLKVTVNGEIWEQVDTFYRVKSQAKVFIARTGLDGGIDIFFGYNGDFGMVPPRGALIEIEYLEHDGVLGNWDTTSTNDFLLEWIEDAETNIGESIDLNETFNLKIGQTPQLGGDIEDPNWTRQLIPISSKNNALIHPDDFEWWFSRITNVQVLDVSPENQNEDFLPNQNLDILLLPTWHNRLTAGEDYFSIDTDRLKFTNQEVQQLLNSLEEQGKQALNINVRISNPELKRYAILVRVSPDEAWRQRYDELRNVIRGDLSDWFLDRQSNNDFKRISRSDLIAIIEDIENIISCDVQFLSEDNEVAIRNGEYTTEVVQTNLPEPKFEVDGSLPTAVKSEKITRTIQLKENENPNLGLNDFGDILVKNNEVPIVKGGWSDRNGNFIQDVFDNELLVGPSNLQIEIVS